ncbi:MAG: hypothetical protein DI539_02550 [Flavobacterium psychrophilum]|nr:MAG: hypothetical protein DI539_02550 [Flavobacterium psychrophilum]
MKKIIAILFAAFLLTMCDTSKSAKGSAKPEVQYKDDFRSASEKEKSALLKKLNATGADYSVLILTQNYKGEQIIVSNEQKTLYKEYPISNKKTGIADEIRIDNTVDTKVYDNLGKKEAVLSAKEAKKHKYIYLMKNPPGGDSPFRITYSNTLRPLE